MSVVAAVDRESFVGPQGAGADHCCWDSVFLELRHDAGFVLELWSFYERWRIPSDPQQQEFQDASAITDPSGVGRPRANFKVLDETRVTYKGTSKMCIFRSVRVTGLSRPELNGDFLEDPSRPIGGQPSWWSADGCRFFYFVEENRHWKINAVRSAGGDGLPAVQPGSRKAGRGFAHSGEVSHGDNPTSALLCPDGWFEATDGEWEPIEALQVSQLDAQVLRFFASEALVEDRTVRGEDVIAAKRTLADPVVFHGWRRGGAAAGAEMRLLLPEVPEHGEEGDLPESAPQLAAGPCGDSGGNGTAVALSEQRPTEDPDAVVLRLSSSRL